LALRKKGRPSFAFAQRPRARRAYDDALLKAVVAGDAGEDDTSGYSLSHNPGLRAIEERFVNFAHNDRSILREVLRDSLDADQRALAAEVLGYAPDHRAVVRDLVFAMSDPNSNVRNNAMRALAILARYAESHPSAGIKVPTHPFINLLNSLVWSDRNKASFALIALIKNRDPALLEKLRERDLPALIEMARWKTPGHANTFCVILGRIAGLSEKEIEDDLQHGEKEKIIAAAQKVGPNESGARQNQHPGVQR
jgi:hypothetical protein